MPRYFAYSCQVSDANDRTDSAPADHADALAARSCGTNEATNAPPFASKPVGPIFRGGWPMTLNHFLNARYTISGMPHEEKSLDNGKAIWLGRPGLI
jgi:hypothetical protein